MTDDKNKQLNKAVTTALKDYLGLSPDETLLVISDSELRNIGLLFHEAAREICFESIYAEIKPRERNGQEPPSQIADLMKNVDVILCPTSKSLTHTEARREASKLGVRVGTMPGITLDTIVRCFSAKPEKIVELSSKIGSLLRKTAAVRITTKLGTDITLPMKGRRILESTGVLNTIGESGNLPSGEVYLAPWERKSAGRVVFDGSFAGIGLLDNPIVVDIRDGFAKRITGGDEAAKLSELFKQAGRDANAVAEFGIGTNYKAKLCGNILEDEKVMGTVHIAFGNNISMGGKISVPSHVDGIIKKPTVYFDNDLIMHEGKFVFE